MVVQEKNKSDMKNIFKTIAILSVLLGMSACQQYDIDTQMTPEKAAASIKMVCDALDAYSVPSTNADNITFNVSSNTPWTITRSSGADWCEVTPSSSASSSLIGDVVVTIANNTTDEDRSATLTLKGENISRVVTITIKQARKGKLFVTPVAQNYSALGGPLNFGIQTNVDWEVRSDASWLTFSRENGSPDPEGRTMTIVATAAPSDVLERTATVTVSAGDEQESFEVTQKAVFTLTEFTESFAAAGESKTFTFKTDLPWEVSADKTWLSFDETEGTGDGKNKTITVTASANDGASRKAVITVKAGEEEKTFEVSQKGFTFEIVTPESTEAPRAGGEIILEVNASIAWTPATETDGWSVEKTDDTHFKVSVSFNNKFATKTGKVSISGDGGAYAELELTQDINFTFSGNYEVLEDGSIKLSGGAKSAITTKDSFRYVTVEAKLTDVHFASSGEMWFYGKVGEANIYNQLTLGGNTRVRTDGNAANGTSTYKSTSYSITEAELNAMASYGISLAPAASDATLLQFDFLYNGAVRGTQNTGYNAFSATEEGTTYSFGFYGSGTADTYYTVTSLDIVAAQE